MDALTGLFENRIVKCDVNRPLDIELAERGELVRNAIDVI